MKKPDIITLDDVLIKAGAGGSWYLPVAQRAFEWDANRIANLVDSILLGYPIGSLMIATAQADHYSFSHNSNTRKCIHPSEERDLVLDGQQRITAMLIAFKGDRFDDPRTGSLQSLWINLAEENTAFREFHDKLGRRFHFFWTALGCENTPGETVKTLNDISEDERPVFGMGGKLPQKGWIRVSELYELAGTDDAIIKAASAAALKPTNSRKLAEDLLERMRTARNAPSIPVFYLNEEPGRDDLSNLNQIFIRLNTGGVALSGVDVFFAGVKKYWPDAEEHLAFILERGRGILDRKRAITLLGRCAIKLIDDRHNRANLDISALSQFYRMDAPNELVERMRSLTPIGAQGPFLWAVQWVCDLLRSRLFAASRELTPGSIAAAVAWAMQRHMAGCQSPGRADIKLILGFTFWTSFFGSRCGRDSYDREVFRLAWEAGSRCEPFPVRSDDMYNICYHHEYVQRWLVARLPVKFRLSSSSDDADVNKVLQLLRSGRSLALNVFQQIEHAPIDWDHLVAYDIARKYLRKGREQHPAMRFVGETANFAGIDSGANRSFQDQWPSKKLGQNGARNYFDPDFIKTNHNLLPGEIAFLIALEDAMKKPDLDEAEKLFKLFTEMRTQRIWDEIIRVVGPPPLARQPEDPSRPG